MSIKQIYLSFFFLVFCLGGCEDEGPDIDVESAIPVRAEVMAYKPIKEYIFATGTVRAIQDASLKAQQSGYYHLQQNPRTGLKFAMGDSVKQGELIIRLGNTEFENQVAIDSKKLNFDISKREYKKQQKLFEKGGITQRELTDSERAYIEARYSYENAKLQLAKLRLTSPFDGVLTNLPFYPAGQLIDMGALLLQVVDYSQLTCEISLPGSELGRIKRGQEVLVTNYSQKSDTLLGEITQVSPALESESRMFKASINLANEDLVLHPGMFVKTDIVIAAKDSAIVIPRHVISQRRGSKIVFIIEKGIAVERKLETGLENQYDVEVISGLKADERLVVEGFETLRHRSRVKVSR